VNISLNWRSFFVQADFLKDIRNIFDNSFAPHWEMVFLERHTFYERAKK